MNRSEFTQQFMESDFQMTKKSEDSHSMTQPEVIADITKKTEEAKLGANMLRRQLIEESLKARGIDVDSIDIDKTIENNELTKKKRMMN